VRSGYLYDEHIFGSCFAVIEHWDAAKGNRISIDATRDEDTSSNAHGNSIREHVAAPASLRYPAHSTRRLNLEGI
jgi:hypothetical protein